MAAGDLHLTFTMPQSIRYVPVAALQAGGAAQTATARADADPPDTTGAAELDQAAADATTPAAGADAVIPETEGEA